MNRLGQKAVVDEEVLFDRQRVVARLQVASAVALDAWPQGQVLRTCRGADGISLHEPRPRQGGLERAGRGQAAGHRLSPELKGQIFSLATWIDGYTDKVLKGEANEIAPLVSVNDTIMQGLAA